MHLANSIATAQRSGCDSGWAPGYGCGRTWSGNGNGETPQKILGQKKRVFLFFCFSQKLDFNFNLFGFWNYRQKNIKQSNTKGVRNHEPIGDSSAMEPVLMPENQKTNNNEYIISSTSETLDKWGPNVVAWAVLSDVCGCKATSLYFVALTSWTSQNQHGSIFRYWLKPQVSLTFSFWLALESLELKGSFRPSFEWKSAVAATNWVSNLANPCEIEVTQSRSSRVDRRSPWNIMKLKAHIRHGIKVSSSSHHLEMIGQGDKVSSYFCRIPGMCCMF